MKGRPTEKLRGMTVQELQGQQAERKKEIFHLRVQQVLGQVENPMRIRTVRKEIARLETIIREKQGLPPPDVHRGGGGQGGS
ncbi:MAG: 50S ribosomal protein L29 [Nitrospirae bacterium]|nr:50S ribosomal protein L29 [Nitrospirota bacterium]